MGVPLAGRGGVSRWAGKRVHTAAACPVPRGGQSGVDCCQCLKLPEPFGNCRRMGESGNILADPVTTLKANLVTWALHLKCNWWWTWTRTQGSTPQLLNPAQVPLLWWFLWGTKELTETELTLEKTSSEECVCLCSAVPKMLLFLWQRSQHSLLQLPLFQIKSK